MPDDGQAMTELRLDRRSSYQQRPVVAMPVFAVRQGTRCRQQDRLVAEEPLEIRVGGPDQEMTSLTVTMRTPRHDAELAMGFLYTEGLIHSRDDVIAVHDGDHPSAGHTCNVIAVRLAQNVDLAALKRHFTATSSCGLCGKASIQQLAVHCAPVMPGPVVDGLVLMQLPKLMRQAQHVFEQTGGLHAAGVFDQAGRMRAVREDIGRHNAVDKLIGLLLHAGEVPLIDRLLLVSGRVSFEIVQKAAVAGAPILCAVSAPSSLAIKAAHHFKMTIVGFLRDQSFNIYTHPERVALEP